MPLIAAVNDGVIGVHELGEGGDGLVNGGANLDEDDDGVRASNREDKIAGGAVVGEGELPSVVVRPMVSSTLEAVRL